MNGWQAGLVGGVLIGLAAALLLWSIGRIAGISGIVNGLPVAPAGDRGWRIAFLAGLVAAGAVALALVPDAPARAQSGPAVSLIVAGLLVGFGTRMGSGCTSGHGVCGLARLSPRSLVAVSVFMAAGFATVYLVRHVLGMTA